MGPQEQAEAIFRALGGKKTAEGYQVKCPCHDDKVSSLSIAVKDGVLLWHCKAGCDGLELADTFKARGFLNGTKKAEPNLVEIYNYPDGLQKLRYEPKDFRARRVDGDTGGYIWKEARKGLKPKLYLTPQLEAAVVRDDIILLCEGEKDVKNFMQIKIPGMFATTNFGGASEWKREYTAQLKGARVIICEDNDKAGRDRVLKAGEAIQGKSIVKVLTFRTKREKYDLTCLIQDLGEPELLAAYIEGNAKPFRIEDYAEQQKTPPLGMAPEAGSKPEGSPQVVIHTSEAIHTPDDSEHTPKRKKIPEATREDYFDLFEKVLGPLPRDKFTGDCMRKVGKVWEAAENYLAKVKSEAHYLETSKIRKYNMQMVDHHYQEYTDIKEPGFLFDIPEWDEVDRLQTISRCLVLSEDQEKFTPKMVESLIKAWMAGIFRKLDDPRFQNPILILKGAQGIGKDHLINTMTDGFGQWSKHLTLSRNDADNLIQLSGSAVLKIAEFDRTSRTDVATIKDMIFRDTYSVRAAYARKSRDSDCRASFAATCNIEDIYRDPTGNRRFVVINLHSIMFRYADSVDDRMQILAQAKRLADDKFKVSEEAAKQMSDYLEGKTPESAEDAAKDEWNFEIEKWAVLNKDTTKGKIILLRSWMTNKEAREYGIIDEVAKTLKSNPRMIRQFLKNAGLEERTKIERGYRFELPKKSVTGDTSTGDRGDKVVTLDMSSRKGSDY